MIRRSGPMTFERYMEMCLYHPEFGYYMQGRERTGVAGDYFTSADLHPILARLIARQASEMWEILGRPSPFTWVEMGAGRGLQRMLEAVDLVAHEIAGEQREMSHQPIRQGGAEGAVMPLQELVFLARAVRHVDEVDGIGVHCASPLGRILFGRSLGAA